MRMLDQLSIHREQLLLLKKRKLLQESERLQSIGITENVSVCHIPQLILRFGERNGVSGERAKWPMRNEVQRSSVHWFVSLDSWPATKSSFVRNVEQTGIMQESTLKAPMKKLIQVTVSGSGQEVRAVM